MRQYLLVDPEDSRGPTVTLFTEPKDGDYQKAVSFPYGAVITLYEPERIVIDTSVFPEPEPEPGPDRRSR